MVDIDILAAKIEGTWMNCPSCKTNLIKEGIQETTTHCTFGTYYTFNEYKSNYDGKEKTYKGYEAYPDDDAAHTKESVTSYYCPVCEEELPKEQVKVLFHEYDGY